MCSKLKHSVRKRDSPSFSTIVTPLTALVIQQLHADGGHHGHERLINELRQRYWVLKTRSTVRKITQACPVCKIQRAKLKAPEMAALPQCRLTPYVRPFTFMGMDYFGPMTVTVGRRHEKRYDVLFTCMTKTYPRSARRDCGKPDNGLCNFGRSSAHLSTREAERDFL